MIRVVAAAIVRSGRVLAARRGPGRAHAGLWELPGGKVEPGESDREALVREIQEELGAQVMVGAHLGDSPWEGRLVLVAYACTLTEGMPTKTEHTELRWVDPEGMLALDWAPADVPLLEPLARLLREPV